MATYNGDRFLEQQIQSLLNQTITPDEIIVCDDCSTDGTSAILEKYRKQQVLTYTVNSSRLGVIDNFTKGVSMAKQENYIALCDQDDEWMPEKLEKTARLMTEIEKPDIPCMVYSDLMYVDQDQNLLNMSFWNEIGKQETYGHNLETLLFGQFVNGCTTLMNPALRNLFKKIPNYARFHHDDWIAVAAFSFGKVARIDDPLVKYRKHDSNVTIKAGTKSRNRYRAIAQQLFKVVKGNDDFLELRFELARIFYEHYAALMTADVKAVFERFLALQSQSYLSKKLAFRQTIHKYHL